MNTTHCKLGHKLAYKQYLNTIKWFKRFYKFDLLFSNVIHFHYIMRFRFRKYF